MDEFSINEFLEDSYKLSNYKTSNALLYVMAGLYQKQHRLDEAIILNQNGFLCESTSSNLFVVYQNQIYTPALSEGCVAGVMRSVVLKLAKMYNLPLIEAQINPDILNEADDSQTLVRLLMYTNKIDIEGLIAVSSCHQYKGKKDPDPNRNTVHPKEIIKYIDAYEKVVANLQKHEQGTRKSKLSLTSISFSLNTDQGVRLWQ